MHGLGSGARGGVQNGVTGQVARSRRRETKPDSDVSVADVPGASVGVAVHGHRAHAHRAQRADHPHRDLAPVGHHNGVEHATHIRKRPKPLGGSGALAQADSASPSTIRVSAGSITPSSHNRAVE